MGKKSFQVPELLVKQLDECSKGFFLVVVNDQDQFQVYQSLDNPVVTLGMANFLEIFSNRMQEELHSNVQPREDEED